jgi:NADPH-dependent ferric siderophore reductase
MTDAQGAPSRRVAVQDRAAAPVYRTYPVHVAAAETLGPNFRRLTFAGEQLRGFGAGGDDQRIKLVLPQPGQSVEDLPSGEDWYVEWRAMPDAERPTMRTYTVRAFRPEVGELDVDFVLHGVDAGTPGPAASWAATASFGDQVGLIGPDRPGRGRMWGCEWAPPLTADRLLLAGDETAVPAMAVILESLPSDARGTVCVEVPHPDDRQPWRHPHGIDVRWLARGGGSGAPPAPHGSLLEAAVAEAMDSMCGRRQIPLGAGQPVVAGPVEGTVAGPVEGTVEGTVAGTVADGGDAAVLWEVPEPGDQDTGPGELYGWLAGEAGMIKRLRRMMVQEYGVARTAVAFMGYWRLGRSEVN